MKSFKEYITEAVKELRWDANPQIGWWEDNDPITLYHGTHISNMDSFLKDGINRKDPQTGMISLAFEPFTARGYASMYGGEADFRKAGGKAKNVPMNERVVFVFKIPMSWIKKNMDPKFGGNIGDAKPRLQNKELYDKWDGQDQQYYQLAELRVKKEVPAKFIKGYMISK